MAEIVYGYAHGGNTARVFFEQEGRGPYKNDYVGGSYTAHLGADGKHIRFSDGRPMLFIDVRSLLNRADTTKDEFIVQVHFSILSDRIVFTRGEMYDHGDRLRKALLAGPMFAATLGLPEPWPDALERGLAEARRKVMGDGDGIADGPAT